MSALPERPWSELSVDFGQVPGMASHFMVISDDYSRYVVVEPVTALTGKAVIPVLDKILSLFGIPDIIKTDNGPPFNSDIFTKFAQHKGFHHRKITPLWPLANAEAERFMRTVKKTIKAAIAEGRNWNQDLHPFLLNYRATPHSSTGIPPATIMFGREIKTTLPQIKFGGPAENVARNDSAAKLKMKNYADKRNQAKVPNLSIGDPVLMKMDRQKNKADPPFDPKPLIVTHRNGSMITAERRGKRVTRNSSFFKPSPKHPVSSEEEREDLEDLFHYEPKQKAPAQAQQIPPIAVPLQQIPPIAVPPQPIPPIAVPQHQRPQRLLRAPVKMKDNVQH